MAWVAGMRKRNAPIGLPSEKEKQKEGNPESLGSEKYPNEGECQMTENKTIEKHGCRPADPKNIGWNEAAKPQKEGKKGENTVNAPKEF